MSTDNRKDLPPVNSPNYDEKMREALQVYLGHRGDVLNRGVTVRDLMDAGMVSLNGIFGGSGTPLTPIYPPVVPPDPLVIDLTPPPTPTWRGGVWNNIAHIGDPCVTPAVSLVLVECDTPMYKVGGGHAKSRLFGIPWTSGALPTFANAKPLAEFQGTPYAHPSNPRTTWHLWLKWVSKGDVESATPAGGTNGVVVTTGLDVASLLEALNSKITATQLYADLGTRINLIDVGPAALTVKVTDLLSTYGTTASSAASASAAAGSATTANTHSSNAGTSAIAAAVSATLASTKAGDALTYSGNAASSATNAAGSVTSASSQAGLAATSNTAAGAAAVAALASQTAAATSATNAAGSATSASSTLTNITAVVAGAASAAVSTESTARITDDNKLFAQYTVKVDVNGYVSGFGLASTLKNGTPYSNFIIRADNFAIASPGLTTVTPFSVVTTPIGTYGSADYIPVGVYIDGGFIKGGTIDGSSIVGGTIEKTKLVGDITFTDLHGGSLSASTWVGSPNYATSGGTQGWRIHADGSAVFQDAAIRGTIYAGAGGTIGGIEIGATYIQSSNYAAGTTGFRISSDGSMALNNITARGGIYGGNHTDGAGAGWPASGGGFTLDSSHLLLGNWRNGGHWFQVNADGSMSMPGMSCSAGTLTISQANVINTLNIGANQVTIPVGQNGSGSIASSTITLAQPGKIMVMVTANALFGSGSYGVASLYVTATCGGSSGSTVGVSISDGSSGSASAIGYFDVGAGPHTVGGTVSIADGARVIGATGMFAIGCMR